MKAATPAWIALADGLERVAAALRELAAQPAQSTPPVTLPVGDWQSLPWPALLWVVPPETRLNMRQIAEAFGRPRSFVYRLTSRNGSTLPRLPCRRLGAELYSTAGELRDWLGRAEVVVVLGRPVTVVERKAAP